LTSDQNARDAVATALREKTIAEAEATRKIDIGKAKLAWVKNVGQANLDRTETISEINNADAQGIAQDANAIVTFRNTTNLNTTTLYFNNLFAADDNYSVALHTEHVAAANKTLQDANAKYAANASIANARTQALAQYQYDAAVARRTEAVADRTQALAYDQQRLSLAEASVTVIENSYVLLATKLAEAANKQAVASAGAIRDYRIDLQKAENKQLKSLTENQTALSVDQVRIQGVSDDGHAEAVRVRDNAYATAGQKYLETYANAEVAYKFNGNVTNFSDVIDQAEQTRTNEKLTAFQAFHGKTDKLQVDAIEGIGAARVSFVAGNGEANVTAVTDRNTAETKLSSKQAKASLDAAGLQTTADVNHVSRLASEAIADNGRRHMPSLNNLTALQTTSVTRQTDLATALGKYHVAVAALDVAQAEANLAADPTNHDLKIKVADEKSNEAWIQSLETIHTTLETNPSAAYHTSNKQAVTNSNALRLDFAQGDAKLGNDQVKADVAYVSNQASIQRTFYSDTSDPYANVSTSNAWTSLIDYGSSVIAEGLLAGAKVVRDIAFAEAEYQWRAVGPDSRSLATQAYSVAEAARLQKLYNDYASASLSNTQKTIVIDLAWSAASSLDIATTGTDYSASDVAALNLMRSPSLT